MAATGRLLRSQVAGLGAPYGLERSCKLTPGTISGDRFLLTLHRSALGPEPLRRIVALLDPIGVPAGLPEQLQGAWPGTDVVHFGYEASGQAEICKVYFEHVDSVRQAFRATERTDRPTLVHRAWKWRVPAAGGFAATDYTWSGNSPGESVMDRIARLCEPQGAGHVSARAVGAVRDLIGDKVCFDELMLLEVREEGTVRRSFDLNLYPADLTVRAIAPVIEQLRVSFALPAAQVAAVFDPVLDLELGHVSGGSAQNSEPFFTIYFGVEGC